jgi:hypothetical protein
MSDTSRNTEALASIFSGTDDIFARISGPRVPEMNGFDLMCNRTGKHTRVTQRRLAEREKALAKRKMWEDSNRIKIIGVRPVRVPFNVEQA